MKIIVNDEESYEIDLPSEIHINKLDFIVTRLSKMVKLFGTDTILTNPEPPVQYVSPVVTNLPKKMGRQPRFTREEVIKIAKVYYDKSMPMSERDKLIYKISGITRKAFAYLIHSYKRKYHIKPQEVGKSKFVTYAR